MRLWSIHPKYLDAKGLVALWREGLLAQKVLDGKTKGYREHPQLQRFKEARNPLSAIGAYLYQVVLEAERREYRFDGSKIIKRRSNIVIPVNSLQLRYETVHLLKKLKKRDPEMFSKLRKRKILGPHPLFYSKPGPIERWEKLSVERPHE